MMIFEPVWQSPRMQERLARQPLMHFEVDPFAPRLAGQRLHRPPESQKPPERLFPAQIADRAFAHSPLSFQSSSEEAARNRTVSGPPTRADVAKRRHAATCRLLRPSD